MPGLIVDKFLQFAFQPALSSHSNRKLYQDVSSCLAIKTRRFEQRRFRLTSIDRSRFATSLINAASLASAHSCGSWSLRSLVNCIAAGCTGLPEGIDWPFRLPRPLVLAALVPANAVPPLVALSMPHNWQTRYLPLVGPVAFLVGRIINVV